MDIRKTVPLMITLEKNREPRNKPTLIWAIKLQKGGKNIQWGRSTLFNKWCWENLVATCKRIKLDYSLTSCTKINSKWVKDLNIRPETNKVLEENTGSILFDIGLSYMFLDMSPQARKTKAKINRTMSN